MDSDFCPSRIGFTIFQKILYRTQLNASSYYHCYHYYQSAKETEALRYSWTQLNSYRKFHNWAVYPLLILIMFFRSQALNYEVHWEVLSIPGQGGEHVISILMIICWCIDPEKRNKGREKLYPTQASSEHLFLSIQTGQNGELERVKTSLSFLTTHTLSAKGEGMF